MGVAAVGLLGPLGAGAVEPLGDVAPQQGDAGDPLGRLLTTERVQGGRQPILVDLAVGGAARDLDRLRCLEGGEGGRRGGDGGDDRPERLPARRPLLGGDLDPPQLPLLGRPLP